MSQSKLQTKVRRASARLPRLGFLGMGWIGRARLQSLVDWGGAEITALVDPSPAAREAGQSLAPDAAAACSLEEILDMDLDGLVVATPPGLHQQHVEAALAAGWAVFCQKPLASTHLGTRRLIEAARSANRLLLVDMSYRRAEAFIRAQQVIRLGAVGRVRAVEAVFHNPYRPGREWSSQVDLSGGGCLIDLGTHLVDLALTSLGPGKISSLTSALFHAGQPMRFPMRPEDYAQLTLRLDHGGVASIVTSWEQVAGDPVIGIVYRGRGGSVEVRNVSGSFYDFETILSRDRQRVVLSSPPDQWGGRLLIEWTRRLAEEDGAYDPSIESLENVAYVIDLAYGRIP